MKHKSPALKARFPRMTKKVLKTPKENSIPTVKPVQPKNSSKKLEYNPKPVEGINFNFEIPENLSKKREIKAGEKANQQNEKDGFKEFADITNQSNMDVVCSTTPLRCITGKSSIVRSSISLLQSINGSGKSTPNITPYKMMRMNKENGKDGTHNISNLELKIKELEQQIMKTKFNKPEDLESENNEFLDDMSQIDFSSMIKSVKKPAKPSSPSKASEQSKKSEDEEKSEEEEKNEKEEPKPQSDNEDEPDEIKELESMIGQVFSTIQKDQKLSSTLQDKIKEYEHITNNLFTSVRSQSNNDFKKSTPKVELSASCKSKKSAQKSKKKPGRRRRSNRHKKRYDHIEIYQKNSRRDNEWFQDNEVWTRSRKRKKLQDDHN